MRAAIAVLLLAGGCSSPPGGARLTRPAAPVAAAPRAPRPVPATAPSEIETRALADRACPAVTAPHFYRVETPSPTYLLGTRHIGVGLAKLPAEVTTRLRAARVAVLETVDEDAPATAPAPPPAANPRALSEQLGPELWQRYQELAGAQLAAVLDHQPPTVALVLLMMLYEDKTVALDQELIATARAAGVAQRGLETTAFQEDLMARWMDLRWLRAAIASTEDRAELQQESASDLAQYCAGTDDDPGMTAEDRAELLAHGYSDDDLARLERDLLDDRNQAWIAPLEQLIAGGNAFVAVGEDHLHGPRGVVALLRARGHRVTRVFEPVRAAAGSAGRKPPHARR